MSGDVPAGGRRSFMFDRDGTPVSAQQFEALMRRGRDYRRVADDEDVVTPDGRTYWVSTIWLGVDHGLGILNDGPPRIFETMVFAGRPGDDWSDQWCGRWSTEAQALAGHAYVVEILRTGAVAADELGGAVGGITDGTTPQDQP